MNNMEVRHIEVKTSLRKKKRELKNALGDDIIRYIAELVTNADDSYKRLGNNCQNEKSIIIELQEDRRTKDGYMVSVTDNAEGMTIDRLEKIFETYGDDNANGIDSHTRGIFGQGASDVLQAAAREHKTAMIETIKDGQPSKLVYNMDENLNSSITITPISNISGNKLQQCRDGWGIPYNGTRITFGIPSTIKFTPKIIRELPESINKYYSFRYILNQSDVKVIFVNKSKPCKLSSSKYIFDESKKLLDENFIFTFEGKTIRCDLKLYKNENKKEDNTNIIVRDENYVVYDNTMFDFQNNAASQNISGELIINGLYGICHEHLNCENPDAIISDNRTGFDTKNPFFISLNKAINPYIDAVLKESREIKITNLNNNKKFNDALKKLNKYMKNELKELIGTGNLSGKTPPVEGIKFVRNYITITKDKTYDLRLMINSRIILSNESIKITCESKEIEFSPSIINYNEIEVEDDLVIKNVSIKGLSITNDSVILKANTATRTATVAIDVVPLEVHYPEKGLEFYPNDLALTVNKDHFIKLYVDSEVIPLNSLIRITCNGLTTNPEIKFISSNMINDSIGVINVIFKGGNLNQNYEINAFYDKYSALAKIVFIEESKNEPQNGGVISGFMLEPNDNWTQSYYHPHTHKIVINNKNFINRKIMGEMDDKDPENPIFNKQQSQYLCDIIANQAATLLVKKKNVKNGDINFDNFEDVIEQIGRLIQQHKNKIYAEIYPAIMGLAEENKKED